MQSSSIDQYCVTHSDTESDLLKEIREYTQKNEQAPAMISGPLVVNTLKSIIKLCHKQVLIYIFSNMHMNHVVGYWLVRVEKSQSSQINFVHTVLLGSHKKHFWCKVEIG